MQSLLETDAANGSPEPTAVNAPLGQKSESIRPERLTTEAATVVIWLPAGQTHGR